MSKAIEAAASVVRREMMVTNPNQTAMHKLAAEAIRAFLEAVAEDEEAVAAAARAASRVPKAEIEAALFKVSMFAEARAAILSLKAMVEG